jgi:hypothetical protein
MAIEPDCIAAAILGGAIAAASAIPDVFCLIDGKPVITDAIGRAWPNPFLADAP